MREIDILCAGVTAYDIIFLVDKHPQEDDKITADSMIQCGGGPAANAAVAGSRLGLKTAFAGYLGNDIYGDLHFNELQTENVDCRFTIRGDLQTPLSTVILKKDGKRTLINYRSQKEYLPKGSFDFTNINPKVMLFDGHEPYISLELIKLAKKQNIPTILDAGSLHAGTELLADKVNYLITSEKFAEQFSKTKDIQKALSILSKLAPNVIITLGDKGLVWKNKSGEGKKSAFNIKAVDTTGAGDAFHGAFAAALVKNFEWEKALEYSSAAAALTCLKIGARIGIPHESELFEFLKTNKI